MQKPSASKCVAFIPARSGSKRLADKNIRPLLGHPLMAYSITSALDSGIFSRVVVSTDSLRYAEIAAYYGADVLMRPPQMAQDTSPDIEWVLHALDVVPCEVYAILRPTSPFRKPETIQRAWEEFRVGPYDSLRAVEKCREHPAKQWVLRNGILHPLLPLVEGSTGAPGHSSQYPSLPAVYVQNASLEMAWAEMTKKFKSIAGEVIHGFLTFGEEGRDINSLYDWQIAEAMVAAGEATLPEVKIPAIQ